VKSFHLESDTQTPIVAELVAAEGDCPHCGVSVDVRETAADSCPRCGGEVHRDSRGTTAGWIVLLITVVMTFGTAAVLALTPVSSWLLEGDFKRKALLVLLPMVGGLLAFNAGRWICRKLGIPTRRVVILAGPKRSGELSPRMKTIVIACIVGIVLAVVGILIYAALH